LSMKKGLPKSNHLQKKLKGNFTEKNVTSFEDKVKLAKDSLLQSCEVKMKVAENDSETIVRMAELIISTFRSGGKLLIAGNGGSASDSQHIATEFTIRYRGSFDRPALPAIALTTDSSAMTAGPNDLGFENTITRMVEAYGRTGDVFLGLSTSGNSENIIRAMVYARKSGMKVIGLLGGSGGKMPPLCDEFVIVPWNSSNHVQESHIAIAHIIVQIVEETLFMK